MLVIRYLPTNKASPVYFFRLTIIKYSKWATL
jgi:hypothetical protein